MDVYPWNQYISQLTKPVEFVDVRRIFRELFSMFLLYCSHHQNKYFSDQEVLVVTDTKILKGSLQLFF